MNAVGIDVSKRKSTVTIRQPGDTVILAPVFMCLHLINKGIDRVTSGLERYNTGSRFYKGALKRGIAIIQKGVHNLHFAQGKSSVIGSVANFLGSMIKTIAH